MKLGLIGCGGIGRRVAEMASAFKMVVYATTGSRKAGSEGAITYMTLEELLPACDVISIHCPLNDSTRGMVDESFISKMKDGAIIINTARGAILDERAVANALNSGKLAGAGLDVLAVEPPLPDNPLLTAKNCLITPHIGWATVAARKRLLGILEENLSSFFSGAELKNRIV
jgi:glycerate dehydrogenase